MVYLYFLCFALLVVGTFAILNLSPITMIDKAKENIFRKPNFKNRQLIFLKKKKENKLVVLLRDLKNALDSSNKGGMFSIIIVLSILGVVFGIVTASFFGNLFLAPVLAFGFSLIPIGYARRLISDYRKHINDELETALSIITTSYIRTEDIVLAVRENISYLKPPINAIFVDFLSDNNLISADIKASLSRLKGKIDNKVFDEWVDTLVQCQDDRSLKDTLFQVIEKLTNIRIVNSEVKGILNGARTEYFVMAGMVVLNIPFLYLINSEWYFTLINTMFGKLVIGISGMAVLITLLAMLKFTKKVE